MFTGCFQLLYFCCLLNGQKVFSGEETNTNIVDPVLRLPNGESHKGTVSNVTYMIRNREWNSSVAEFTIDPDLWVTYNNPGTYVRLQGQSQLKLVFTKGLKLSLILNLNGLATSRIGDGNEQHLGGYVTKEACCITGSGPGGGFLFHGAGHRGVGGGAWDSFSQNYDSSYILGGSTGAKINEIDPGTGGGVLQIVVHGNLTIDSNAVISANGYNVLNTTELVCPGGSSGGYIYIKAYNINLNGQLSVRGGSSGFSSTLNDYCGDGGSGGILKLNAFRIVYGAMNTKEAISGGKGSTDGAIGTIIATLTFSKEINIDTNECTWESRFDFPGYKFTGSKANPITDEVPCVFEFHHSLVIEATTLVKVTGKSPLKIVLYSGSFHLYTAINLTYSGGPLSGNTSVGGYHSEGTYQGPGAKETFATHGDLLSPDGSYGVNPVQLIGGSTCSGKEFTQVSVGGAAIEIQVSKGSVNLYDGASIVADAYFLLMKPQSSCGASGGTIIIAAEKIIFHSASTLISARGIKGTSGSGHGGVISLKACVRTVYNEGNIKEYKKLHLNVNGGESKNKGFIQDFTNIYIEACPGVKPSKSSVLIDSSIKMSSKITIDSSSSFEMSIPQSTTMSSRYQSSVYTTLHPTPSKRYVTSSILHTKEVRPEIQSMNVTITDKNLKKVSKQLRDIVTNTEDLTPAEEEIILSVYENIAHKSSAIKNVEQISEMVQISDLVLNNQLKASEMKLDVVATRLLESLEEMGINTPTKVVNETYIAKSERTILEISSIGNSSRNTYPTFCSQNDSCVRIELPTKILDDMPGPWQFISMSEMLATSIIKEKQMRQSLRFQRGQMTNITSSLLSIYINPPLPTPFTVPMRLVQQIENNPHLNTTNITNIQSWYWKTHGNTNNGVWSSHGIVPISRSNHTVISEIYHLTSFALLVQVTNYEIPVKHLVSLEIITYIGCGLSLFGFLLTFATLVSIQTLSSDRTKIHTNLAAALGIAQIIFLTGIDATDNSIMCGAVAILLHYFFTAAFGWMLAEGVHLYTKVVHVFQDGRSKMKFYYFIGWGTPVILVSISAAVRPGGYGTSRACWISTNKGHIWAFVGPVCLVIIINVLIMASVLKVLIASVATPTDVANAKTKEQVKAALKAMVILMPILGITWLFGMFAINEQTLFLQYLFTILNSFQGVLIFMFYCVFNSEVRAALKRLRENYQASRMLSKSSVETSIGTNVKDKIKRKVQRGSPGGRKFSRMNSTGNIISNTQQQSSL